MFSNCVGGRSSGGLLCSRGHEAMGIRAQMPFQVVIQTGITCRGFGSYWRNCFVEKRKPLHPVSADGWVVHSLSITRESRTAAVATGSFWSLSVPVRPHFSRAVREWRHEAQFVVRAKDRGPYIDRPCDWAKMTEGRNRSYACSEGRYLEDSWS